MRSANKVAFNTAILYFRMLLTVGISLYATRLVLNALGEADYGIFNLIAGIITMLSFLNAAMTTSTQRYLSFHQGKQDIAMQKKVFSNSMFIHIIIGLIIVIALEFAGFFLFDGFLNIPINRIDSAKTIYHFMSATVFFTVIAVPFTGSLTAHENMLWIAIVNIIETISRIAIALILFVVSGDKLITYGLLTAGISILSFVMYAVFCFKKYEECTFDGIMIADKQIIKELTSFAGWNLFGSLCGIGRSQGLAILLNLFFGTVVNAAYGIANQVAAQLGFFSATMLRALNPQIMKSEGANDRSRMLRLSMIASKFGYFLLAIFAIPCIFEMKTILMLWLKTVPDNTVIFCTLILIGTMVNQLTIGLQSAIQATGKIKIYMAVVGSVILLNVPIGYLLLKLNFPPYSVLIGFAVIEFIACCLRLYFLKLLAGLSIKEYLMSVTLLEIIPTIVIIMVCYLITNYVLIDYRFIFTFFGAFFSFVISIYWYGLSTDEKQMVHKIVEKLILKIKSIFLKYQKSKIV